MNLRHILTHTRLASESLRKLSSQDRAAILLDLAASLEHNKKKILAANARDVVRAQHNHTSPAFIDRLTLGEHTFHNMVHQVRSVAKQPDVLGEVIEQRTVANGVRLEKRRIPLGVIGIIYEARPNVTIDVTALCVKSGNAAVLKGGSDAQQTNLALMHCVHEALTQHHLAPETISFLDTADHRTVGRLLRQVGLLDVIIPRGGYELVRRVVNESKIPVLYHAAGGARIYVDHSGDQQLALRILVNAKTQRPATCNSLDTVIVEESLLADFLPKLAAALHERGVELRADTLANAILHVRKATPQDYDTEFLGPVIAVKTVKDVHEAIGFIEKHSKGHSEGIIAQNPQVIQEFVDHIDAAGIFVNCSPRLHDGGIFELGAEMGIATGKLHARGPVGVKELTTYKWIAYGTGQVRE